MPEKAVDVSVIIPIYNGESFVDALIESLRQQTFESFEVVVVNDGSVDGTARKLEAASATELPFLLTVISQKNAGVSAARNVGLRGAKGTYVCFVDADDIIAPDYLEVLYDAVKSSGARIAAAHITRQEAELYEKLPSDHRLLSSTEFLREFLYRGIRYSVCACMFHRDCFAQRGICFPEGYRYSEDVFVLWQLFAAEPSIAEVERKLYYYFDNPGSAMNKGIDLKRMDAIILMKKLEAILPELNPEFAPEFIRYAVARHHWSILWQAATRLDTFGKFKEYCTHFEMRSQLKKLLRYPEVRISLSSLAYVLCPFVYYHMLRMFVKMKLV